jgi:serine/threonine protein kinase
LELIESAEFLARGGFGLVYFATDPKGELVALKIGDVAGGGRYVTRFMESPASAAPKASRPTRRPPRRSSSARTARASTSSTRTRSTDDQERGRAAAPHRHQRRRVREIFQHEGRNVLVLDYVRGKTLREKIRALEGIRLNWFLTIVRALQKLAKAGELAYHGDLKPENIIVKPSGSVVLDRPGHARRRARRDHDHAALQPAAPARQKADVMGIGVMLYEILTGVLPFDEVPWQYAGREQGGEVERLSLSYFLSYPPPRDLNPNTPEPLAKIVYRCLTVMDYGLAELEKDLVDFLRRD